MKHRRDAVSSAVGACERSLQAECKHIRLAWDNHPRSAARYPGGCAAAARFRLCDFG